MIKVSEEKPDPSPPSCGQPSVIGICVELKKDADVKDEEASGMCPANPDSLLQDSRTLLTDREETGVPKQGKTAKQQISHFTEATTMNKNPALPQLVTINLCSEFALDYRDVDCTL